jgi:DNA-directed RNA polymerase subunit RPC12/RpoP
MSRHELHCANCGLTGPRSDFDEVGMDVQCPRCGSITEVSLDGP